MTGDGVRQWLPELCGNASGSPSALADRSKASLRAASLIAMRTGMDAHLRDGPGRYCHSRSVQSPSSDQK